MARARSSAELAKLAARRERVAALYLQGQSQYAIARVEKTDHSTISRDLKALREVWLASAVRHFGERQAEELAKVDRLEAEAWAAWDRSKEPAETTTAEKTDGTRKSSKASKRVEERDGNPAFLAVVERCISKRCEILGLDAPKKMVIGPPPDISKMTPDERANLLVTLRSVFTPATVAGSGA